LLTNTAFKKTLWKRPVHWATCADSRWASSVQQSRRPWCRSRLSCRNNKYLPAQSKHFCHSIQL